MRNDLKIGMAIGGLLLLLVIVWLVLPRKASDTGSLADNKTTSKTDPGAGGKAPQPTGSGSEAPEQPAAPDDEETGSSSPTYLVERTTGGSDAVDTPGPVADEATEDPEAVADATQTNTFAGGDEPAPVAEDEDATSSSGTRTGVAANADWADLLGGAAPLIAHTPSPGSANAADASAADADEASGLPDQRANRPGGREAIQDLIGTTDETAAANDADAEAGDTNDLSGSSYASNDTRGETGTGRTRERRRPRPRAPHPPRRDLLLHRQGLVRQRQVPRRH